MCPNCFSSIAMAPALLLGASLGGAGSAALLAVARLRFRKALAAEATLSNTEETAS